MAEAHHIATSLSTYPKGVVAVVAIALRQVATTASLALPGPAYGALVELRRVRAMMPRLDRALSELDRERMARGLDAAYSGFGVEATKLCAHVDRLLTRLGWMESLQYPASLREWERFKVTTATRLRATGQDWLQIAQLLPERGVAQEVIVTRLKKRVERRKNAEARTGSRGRR